MRNYQILPLNKIISISAISLSLLLLLSTFYFLIIQPFTLSHVAIQIMLQSAVKNTIIIGVFTAILAGSIGVLFAYVNVFYNYRFKKTLHLLAILPIAIPVYIHAYNYSKMFSINGSLASIVGSLTSNPSFSLNVRNIWFAILIFSFSLYPYVYLMVRSALKQTNYALVESSQLLKRSHTKALLSTTFPLIRKVLFLSIVLVLAETFSDIGVVEYFNINTISLLVLRLYRNYNDFAASFVIGFGFSSLLIGLFLYEKYKMKRFITSTSKYRNIRTVEMTAIFKVSFFTLYTFIISFAFIIPVLQMIQWVIISNNTFTSAYFEVITNTLYLMILVLLFILAIAIAVSHTARNNKIIYGLSAVLNFGYMLMSILISLMIMIFIQVINFFFSTRLSVSASIFFIVLAMTLKFLPIMLNALNKSYAQLPMQIIESSYILNASKLKTFLKVELPLLKTVIISSSILVMIDILKELTLTLTLRPFNFDTLALRVSMFAKDERILDSAIYSLTIVFIVSLLVLFLYSREDHNVKNK